MARRKKVLDTWEAVAREALSNQVEGTKVLRDVLDVSREILDEVCIIRREAYNVGEEREVERLPQSEVPVKGNIAAMMKGADNEG